MASIKRRSLLAWVAGVVLTCILCAHAISLDPGNLRESVSRGPLLAQAALRGAPASAFLRHQVLELPRTPPGSLVMPPANLRAAPSRRGVLKEAPRPAPRARTSSLVIPMPKATPAYRRTFNVLRNRPEITDRYDEIILEQSIRCRMNPRLVKAIIAAESEFSASALSPRGARGLMQILPETAEEMGVPRQALGDPAGNIRAGTAYLEHLYAAAWKQYRLKGVEYRDAPPWVLQRIIASYNAGPRALTRGRWMRQTRNYVRKVLLFYRCDVSEFRRGSPRNGPRRLLAADVMLP